MFSVYWSRSLGSIALGPVVRQYIMVHSIWWSKAAQLVAAKKQREGGRERERKRRGHSPSSLPNFLPHGPLNLLKFPYLPTMPTGWQLGFLACGVWGYI
jgi:hypothetical protein